MDVGASKTGHVQRVASALLAALALLGPLVGPGLLPAAAADQPEGAGHIVDAPTGTVNAIAESTGVSYYGGSFTSVGAATGAGAQVDATAGTVDRAFPYIGVEGAGTATVNAAVPDGEGGYYIGGVFGLVNGIPRSNAARILADGTLDPRWDPSPDSTVWAIAVQGSTVYLGGTFTTVRQAAAAKVRRDRAAAVDATSGYASAWNPQPNDTVYALGATESAVYLGGLFTRVGQVNRSRAAAVDPVDGSATAWDPNLAGGSSAVRAIAVAPDSIYLGGAFTSVRQDATTAASRSNVAQVDALTGYATAWAPDPSADVRAIVLAGSTVYLGGAFTSVRGPDSTAVSRRNAAAISTAGEVRAWDPNPSNTVLALSMVNSTVYLGGSFTTVRSGAASSVSRAAAAAVDATNGHAAAWNPIVESNKSVNALVASASSVYLGGNFAYANVVSRSRAAAFDADGRVTAWDPSPSSTVSALAVDGDTVYLGGSFTTVRRNASTSATRNRAAAVNAATGYATAWDPGPNGTVTALALAGDTVYLAGAFTTVRQDASISATRNRAAAVSAATGFATAWDPNPNDAVNVLAVAGDTVYLGGSFTAVRQDASTTTARRYVAATQAATGFATSWDPNPNGAVNALDVAEGTVYLGGAFTSVRQDALTTAARRYVAAVDTVTAFATSWDPNPNNTVNTVAVDGDAVYLGGAFTSVRQDASTSTARARAAAVGVVTGFATPWSPNLESAPTAMTVSDAAVRANAKARLLSQGQGQYSSSALPSGAYPPQPTRAAISAGMLAWTPGFFGGAQESWVVYREVGTSRWGTFARGSLGNGVDLNEPLVEAGACSAANTAMGWTRCPMPWSWNPGATYEFGVVPRAQERNALLPVNVIATYEVPTPSEGAGGETEPMLPTAPAPVDDPDPTDADPTAAPESPAEPAATSYQPLVPARLVDTRAAGVTVDGVGPKGALGAGEALRVPVSGRHGIPGDAVGAVAVNVTAVGPTRNTYLTVWPTGAERPTASTMNPAAGQTVASMAIVAVGADGSFSVFNAEGATEVVVDVLGWFPTGGDYQAVVPVRFADTRAGGATIDGAGPKGSLGAGGVVEVPVAGRHAVPESGVGAVVVNVTAVVPTFNTFLSAWPSGEERPIASTLNLVAGQTVANVAIVKLAPNGAFSVFNAQGATDLVVDVLGWFPAGADYQGLSPARLADTRTAGATVDGAGPEGGLQAGGSVRIPVAGRHGLPDSGVAAVVVNVTAVSPTRNTFLSTWPSDAQRPTASTMNPAAGQTVANMALVKVGEDGTISVYNDQGSADVVVDLLGWFPQ